MEAYFAGPKTDDGEQRVATASAKLLGHVLNQFYFSSGAFENNNNDDHRRDPGLVIEGFAPSRKPP